MQEQEQTHKQQELHPDCPFCNLTHKKILFSNALACAFYDEAPVSPGHILIVPKRHVQSFFGLSLDERNAIDDLIIRARDFLDIKYHPDGYNIGVNINQSAGQSVMHVHIHVIPRYEGDTAKPRGGVRGVIPDKQDY